MNTAHWDYVNNILSDSLSNNDSKPFWNYIKAKKQDNVGISPLKRDGVLFNDKIDTANILNDQFTSVFTQEDGNAIPTLKGDKFPSIDELTITYENIEKLLRDLKPNKASGPGCVPARFLKETATELAPALSAFFTQSLNKSTHIWTYIHKWTCLHHMVISRCQNKITDFFMILAWVWAFKNVV